MQLNLVDTLKEQQKSTYNVSALAFAHSKN